MYSSVLPEKKLRRNLVMYCVVVFSILLHCLISLQIHFYKLKSRKTIVCPTTSIANPSKTSFVASLETKSLSGFFSAFSYLLLVLLAVTLIFYLNSIDYNKLKLFPFNLIVYFYHFGLFHLVCAWISLLYYWQHPPMRRIMVREAKMLF